MKEQHLIHTLGLGWEEAHHPWTKNGQAYSSRQLLDHLCNVVIPLATKLNVPDDTPAKLPTVLDIDKWLGVFSFTVKLACKIMVAF